MSKPNNSIANIKLPGENSQRPIVPYALGYSSSNSYQATLPNLTADDFIITAGTNQTITGTKTFTKSIYANHADLTIIGQQGAFGLRAAKLDGMTVPHLGQINLSKNFGGDGHQYGIQMSAVDITNNLFNQMRVYQAGVAYQQYFNSSGVTRNLFTISTTGNLGMYGDTITDLQRNYTYITPGKSGTLVVVSDLPQIERYV